MPDSMVAVLAANHVRRTHRSSETAEPPRITPASLRGALFGEVLLWLPPPAARQGTAAVPPELAQHGLANVQSPANPYRRKQTSANLSVKLALAHKGEKTPTSERNRKEVTDVRDRSMSPT